MRCACRMCQSFMVHSEGSRVSCVCPSCGWRCRDCLGTDTVVQRDHLKDLIADRRFDPTRFSFEALSQSVLDPEDEDDDRWEDPRDAW